MSLHPTPVAKTATPLYPVPKMPMLENLQHEKFCNEFLIDFNGTQAAIRAGYSPGDGGASARSQGARLLANDYVAARIRELAKETAGDAIVSIRMVLEELKRIASCDAKQAFNEDGSPKKITELSEDISKCISSFEVEDIYEGQGKNRVYVGELRKVKFWDKNKGLEMIGRYLKMFTERIEHDVGGNLEALLTNSWDQNGREQSNQPLPVKTIGPGNP